jgi:hypothetical protein
VTDKDEGVGYGKPPRESRFRKGQSGNPKGRPKGRRRGIPHDVVLGQKVVIREGEAERTVTAAEAFLLYLIKRGIEGDAAAAKLAREAIAVGQRFRTAKGGPDTIIVSWGSSSPNEALEALKMATRLDRFRPSARMTLEPWLVEAALARLGDRRLTPEQQATIVKAMRIPHKVHWPDWWEGRSEVEQKE